MGPELIIKRIAVFADTSLGPGVYHTHARARTHSVLF